MKFHFSLSSLAACGCFLLSLPCAQAQFAVVPGKKAALTVEQLAPLIGGPTLVTLQGKDIPLQTAVETLLKAANLPLQGALSNADAARTVTVNWKDTPFWEAAQDLEKQTGLKWSAPPDRQSTSVLRLGQRDVLGRPGGLNGLWGARTPLGVVVANGIIQKLQESLSFVPGELVTGFSNPLSNDVPGAYLMVNAYLDPRLLVAPDSIRMELTTPGNEAGVNNYRNSLRFSRPDSLVGLNSTPLYLGDQSKQTKVPIVSGTLYATVIPKLERWEIPDLVVTKMGARIVNGTTCNLENVDLNGESLTLKVSMHGTIVRDLNGGTSLRVSLLDGEGNLISPNGRNISGSGSTEDCQGEYRYSLRVPSPDFPDGEVRPGPFKLVWDIPTELKTVRIPFEFRDVPLP